MTQQVREIMTARPAGIVSLGDLAMERDPGSAPADISAARPNRWPAGREAER